MGGGAGATVAVLEAQKRKEEKEQDAYAGEKARIKEIRRKEKQEQKDHDMAEQLAKERDEVAEQEQAKKDAAAAAAAGSSSSTTAAYYVTVPQGVFTGMQFKVDVNGKQYTVTCPQNASPGQKNQNALPSAKPSSTSSSQTNT